MIIIFGSHISVGVVGLCLTYMIPLPGQMSSLISCFAGLENEMVSVERVKAYMGIPSEQPVFSNFDKKHLNWPIKPSIRFSKVYLKYRPNTEMVLKGLSFDIPEGTRVGITGRTGSGKSSLFLALLRIVELDKGFVAIDNVNVALLGLKKLREAITLIPQDPLVFNGTVKENLDPLGRFDDFRLKNVLNEVGLLFELDHVILNSGKNVSIGERQLISLCRALICNTKIILFDETTAGIDLEMDSKIQNIIKVKFQGCTILTIAHRLKTIIDSDLILLLSDGKLKEFGNPQHLLSFDSEFKNLSKTLH